MLIKFTIDRFEEDKVVLVANDGTMIIWPKNKLPNNIHEGSALSFDITETAEREKSDKQTAKDIINEIIKNS
ncbi:MAG: DUF3006 domain-containing protein [bacterium]